MTDLKLAKLPDRAPVKLAINLLPDLYRNLRHYAELYRIQFGQAEPVEELIPFMLGAFLESDRAFTKAKKEGAIDLATPLPGEPGRRGGWKRPRPLVPPAASKGEG
jgi:hypothetical protein